MKNKVMDVETASTAIKNHPALQSAINLITLVATIPGAIIQFKNVNGKITSEFRFKS